MTAADWAKWKCTKRAGGDGTPLEYTHPSGYRVVACGPWRHAIAAPSGEHLKGKRGRVRYFRSADAAMSIAEEEAAAVEVA